MSKKKTRGKNNGGIFRVPQDLLDRVIELITEEEKLDVNDLSYEEYMELPGDVRL